MKPTPEIIAIVNRVPDLDEHGKVHGTPWEENAPIYDALLEKGADAIRQVVGMLHAVDDGTDYKPRYVLHAMVMYTGRPTRETQGKVLRQTLCSELAGDYDPGIKGYLLRQLQLIGNAESVSAIEPFLLDDENWEYAAQALQTIGGEASLAAFRRALSRAEGDQLLTVVQALGVFRDTASAAAIRPHLKHAREDIRLAAAWALATMGDAASADQILALADAAGGWARQMATDACFTLAQRSDDAAVSRRILSHLAETRTEDSERYIREAAERL